ncbi:3311_t:CDS:1, partial [Entrophospora sp. SA101]
TIAQVILGATKATVKPTTVNKLWMASKRILIDQITTKWFQLLVNCSRTILQ